jgi:hypothetical protein
MLQWVCGHSRDLQLAIDPDAGTWRALGRGEHVPWMKLSQGRAALDGQGVLALILSSEKPCLFVDGETFALADPRLVVELRKRAPGLRELRVCFDDRVLRADLAPIPVAPPTDWESELPIEKTPEELDFALLLTNRLAIRGFRERWSDLDAPPGAISPDDVRHFCASTAGDRFRVSGVERVGASVRLGALEVAHGTARGGYGSQLGGGASLRTFPVEGVGGEAGVAAVLRLFDLSRDLLRCEEILIGWVSEEKTVALRGWLAELRDEIAAQCGLSLPIRGGLAFDAGCGSLG